MQDSRRQKIRLQLNVYDLTALNEHVYCVGLGAFHSGVVIHDRDVKEWSFGYHPFETTGVFFLPTPGIIPNNPACVLRETLDLGEIDISSVALNEKIEKLSKLYPGNSYRLLERNCNHFTDDLVRELTGEGIPSWVNRTSWWISKLECIIPEKYFPKGPEEVSAPTCTCGKDHDQDQWGEGRRLSETDGPTPNLPQDIVERRLLIERYTVERLKKV